MQAIGEPPLFLAASVFFAIKDAISSARSDAGMPIEFRLDSPATAERIRMACVDQFTKQVGIWVLKLLADATVLETFIEWDIHAFCGEGELNIFEYQSLFCYSGKIIKRRNTKWDLQGYDVITIMTEKHIVWVS